MRAVALIFISVMLFGCVQTPTQTTEIVDDRPRVSFDVGALENKLHLYDVRIDGIVYGSVEQYQRDKNTLPLLPGQHVVEVLLNGDVIFKKDVFLGENSTRIIKVIHYE